MPGDEDRTARGHPEGVSLLDGVALVSGAAVASIHVRAVMPAGLSGFGLAAVWGTFTWVALSATGPFIFIVRRYVRRAPDYPRVGDRLWALLGLPWIVAGLLRSAAGDARAQRGDLASWCLCAGLAAASLVALAVVWGTWVTVPPEQAAKTASHPWTNRLGLVLAVAWPVQCGLGMLMLG